MAEPSASRRLARFALGLRPEDLPKSVVDRASLLVLDTLGSCLASSSLDFGRAVTATALALGGRAESSVAGSSERVGAASAVLANGTLAHGLDFDDTREGAIVHTGCVAVATALAVGEAVRATGAAMLEAVVAAVEVMCRVGLAVPGQLHARHFHPTAVTGAFAAAAAAGRLRGLDEDTLVHALGIAGSQASGIIEYLADGTWTKRMHPGWAAHAGVVAVELARSGFTGPARVLEGEHGFYQALAGGHDAVVLEQLLGSLGHEWELEQLTFKPYPCGSIAHPYMDCALRLRREHGLQPGQIAEVRCRTAAGPLPRLWEPLAAKRRPTNGYAAKFSLPYLLAAIFVRGEAGLSAFSDAAVTDEAVLRVAATVGYEIDPTIDYPRRFVGHVAVRLRDGRWLEAEQPHPRGGPDAPLTREELEAKFRGNAGERLAAPATERLLREVAALPARANLESLAALLRGDMP
jgi:2-methylcitrate dehydratase PrpD